MVEPDGEHVNQPEESKGKSGKQLGQDNVESVKKYIQELRGSGSSLPIRNGQPNWSVIALACGFNRKVFYPGGNAEAKALILEACADKDIRIGSEIPIDAGIDSRTVGAPEGTPKIRRGRDAYDQRQLDECKRRVQDLERKLALKTAEVEVLSEKLTQYSVFEEVMSSSGRRYIP